MNPQPTIRALRRPEELAEVFRLEQAIWGTETTPVHVTLTTAHHGGVVLGAYDGDRLVGFVYGFPGHARGETYLCSHTAGVDSAWRGRGLGFRLKRAQREAALAKGYRRMVWTYDPLESRNARLNLHKLGARAVAFSIDHYGTMPDALNGDLPTDRFLVDWRLDTEPHNRPPFPESSLDRLLLRAEVDAAGWPEPIAADKALERISVEKGPWLTAIPGQFQQLRDQNPELALRWRLATRKLFTALIDRGFAAVDFAQCDVSGCYLWRAATAID